MEDFFSFTPYQSVGPIVLGTATYHDVITAFGKPDLDEIRYDDVGEQSHRSWRHLMYSKKGIGFVFSGVEANESNAVDAIYVVHPYAGKGSCGLELGMEAELAKSLLEPCCSVTFETMDGNVLLYSLTPEGPDVLQIWIENGLLKRIKLFRVA